ncbi:quinone oxidoreductase family protein [Kitasatospora kifunensis]|uniref:NADPH:quinone reductase-like Zn-dependent oxidoreductase n=1 Tax=Kitasatospora kifunensis TaxID=58351 RepID=A0A7W7R7P6_KITKI|nr:zinc-binding dehydrogenase [Kitasatospora kifunensis]MBB4926809.1 NADPH:quinone reductase-like Zn-dependent oxidoreductase [Kitasatospora kifunensis]
MRKVRFHRYGNAEVLRLDEVAAPTPGPGEVLVAVEAAGVSLMLLKMLAGAGEAPLPGSPGGGFVGRIAAVGAEVTECQVGDRVGGVAAETYADLLLATPALITSVPEGASAADALCLVHGGLVALAALRVGALEPGQSVLVTNAAGGVGHLIVQLAKALGAARVVAAVSSSDKGEFLRSQGADEVVGYQDVHWGAPVDLVLEGAGGEVLPRALAALLPFGRLVTLAGYGGTLDAGAVLGSAVTVTGLSMGQLARHRPKLVADCRAELWRLLAEGRLCPSTQVFGLEHAAEAVTLLQARGSLGKVVLSVESVES